MGSPLVHCGSCGREWRSPTMAEGLREVGACPRCGGTLSFRDAVGAAAPVAQPAAPSAGTAPHLVLGVPRR